MTDPQTPATEALPRLTHGRHCGCTACRMEDWTNPRLAPCGMHGPSCPAVYVPYVRAEYEARRTEQTPATEAGRRITAWADCVQRLIAVAPVEVVMDEVGITQRNHSTPPERLAIRVEARDIVDRWLARDLAETER